MHLIASVRPSFHFSVLITAEPFDLRYQGLVFAECKETSISFKFQPNFLEGGEG